MKKNFFFKIAIILFFSVLMISCGERSFSSNNDSDSANNIADSENIIDLDNLDDSGNTADPDIVDSDVIDSEIIDSDDTAVIDETATDEENESEADDDQNSSSYPEVTGSSKKVGEVAQNLIFFDENNVEHQLSEWYKPNDASSKLIWLIFASYDGFSCRFERDDIPGLNKQEYREKGLKIILIMNGYLTGPKPSSEPGLLTNLKDTLILANGESADFNYGYLALAQQSTFAKFINDGYPVNVFIDASNMKILNHFEGWSDDQASIDSVETFIKGTLDK
ncbi:MAG TPA: hypothetical protein PLZ43_16345 [bacterium]|nr:hypothetical protein [bacterium]